MTLDPVTAPGARVDGRTARRDRNKEAVLDAVIDLFGEDNLAPGVHEVAERSGVSLRSVYRYFEDLDALIAAAIARQLEQARPLFAIDDLGEGTLEERIERLARRRVELYEQVRTIYAASCVRARLDAQVAAGLVEARGNLARQSAAMFEPELATRPDEEAEMLAVSIDVLTQFDALERLRSDLGLDVEQTVHHLVDGLRRILAA